VLEERIAAAIDAAEVRVEDATGTGDHFRAEVAAPAFAGLSRLAQHRLVYAAVQDLLDDGSIHALSIATIVKEPA
jgi:stress-induced morphogen